MNFLQSQNPSISEVMKLTTPTSQGSNTERKCARILRLAQMFNEVSGSDRPLIPDFYDCGTNARAIFMHLINIHRGNKSLNAKTHVLYPHEISAIYDDYRPSNISNTEKLQEAINILKNMQEGVMILTVRYWYPFLEADVHNEDDYSKKNDYGPNRILYKTPEKQFGHVWVIEKKRNLFYIYQSSLNEYMTYDYFCEKGAVLKEGGPGFLASLRPLVQAKIWLVKCERLFRDKFWFIPKIKKDTRLRPEFFYAYVEY